MCSNHGKNRARDSLHLIFVKLCYLSKYEAWPEAPQILLYLIHANSIHYTRRLIPLVRNYSKYYDMLFVLLKYNLISAGARQNVEFLIAKVHSVDKRTTKFLLLSMDLRQTMCKIGHPYM